MSYASLADADVTSHPIGTGDWTREWQDDGLLCPWRPGQRPYASSTISAPCAGGRPPPSPSQLCSRCKAPLATARLIEGAKKGREAARSAESKAKMAAARRRIRHEEHQWHPSQLPPCLTEQFYVEEVKPKLLSKTNRDVMLGCGLSRECRSCPARACRAPSKTLARSSAPDRRGQKRRLGMLWRAGSHLGQFDRWRHELDQAALHQHECEPTVKLPSDCG